MRYTGALAEFILTMNDNVLLPYPPIFS